MAKLTFRQSLDLALDYIAFNLTRYIFPIKAGSKFPPLIKNNLDDASRDPAQIEKWARQFPGCNWGVAHRKSGLMVIDVDVKPGKSGQQTFDFLDLDYGFPATEMTRTPSGGFHKVYEGEHIFALGQFGFGDGVDSPNYTIIPGSSFADGTSYVAEVVGPTATAPQWFYEFLASKKRERNTSAGESAVDLDKPENITWAKQFLAEDAEPAIEGKAGDAQTLKIAMGLRDRGISQELAFELMRDIYNERCQPPWELEELERKVGNGFKYANQSRIGDRTAEADFEQDIDDAASVDSIKTEWTPEQIAKSKKQRAKEKKKEASRPDGPRKFPTKKEITEDFAYIGAEFDRFISKEDPSLIWKPGGFDRHFKSVQPKGKLSETLLIQKTGGIDRFNGLCYMPGRPVTVDGKLNLYRAPNVVPVEGDTSWWNEHLEYLFPVENEREAVKNWLAWFLQNLDKKPKHALMIQGHAQGTGKSFIPNIMRKLLGDRNVAAVTQTDLTGQFNGFAMRAKLLVVEELRAVERNEVRNRIHDMITEDTISVNEKNMPRFDMPNVFGFITMTNMDAAISLDKTDRRYLVARTDAAPRETAYYSRLYARLDDPDCIAAVAFELMNRNVGAYSGAGPAPKTKAKEAMIEAGLPELEQFMLDHAGEWPFNARVVAVDDVLEALPAQLQRTGRVRANIVTALREHFDGEAAGQRRLQDGSRPRLYVINKCPVLKINDGEELTRIYEMDRDKKKIEAEKDFDDDDGLTAEPESE